jgi:transcriptional regulator with GAF, ATPase, and Fis domain
MDDDESDIVEISCGDRTVRFSDRNTRQMAAELTRVARTRQAVLVLGETGAGKEVAARAIHRLSPRGDGPFVVVNCAAIPDALMESELFGHERGAFSGAFAARIGYVEAANGGTLFLDEVGELGLGAQARLLRALSEHRIVRLGSTSELRVDVRVVAATNRDLDAEVAAGRFREDIYFRLSGATLVVPPLRTRPLDLIRLATGFLAEARREQERAPALLSSAARACVRGYRWPGNVRELKNAMIYAAARADGDEVDVAHLPARVTERSMPVSPAARAELAAEFRPIDDEINELVSLRMKQALNATGGVQSAAAKLIHMPRRTFIDRMRAYGIVARRVRGGRAVREPRPDS